MAEITFGYIYILKNTLFRDIDTYNLNKDSFKHICYMAFLPTFSLNYTYKGWENFNKNSTME